MSIEKVTTKIIKETVFNDNFKIVVLNIKSKNRLNSKVILLALKFIDLFIGSFIQRFYGNHFF